MIVGLIKNHLENAVSLLVLRRGISLTVWSACVSLCTRHFVFNIYNYNNEIKLAKRRIRWHWL